MLRQDKLKKYRVLIVSFSGIFIFSILSLILWRYIYSKEKDIFRYQVDIIQERLIGNAKRLLQFNLCIDY